MTRSLLTLFLAITIVFGFETCTIESFQSQYAQTGSNSQICNDSCIFKAPLRFYDTNTRLQYSVYNDNKNLYVYIKTTEGIVQHKILQCGILLKLDTTSKHKKNVSLLYPIPNKGKKKERIPFNSPSEWDIYVSRFSYDHAFMNSSGFKDILENELSTNNQFGLSAAISWDMQGVLCYKATIPFSRFYKDSLTLSDSNRIFSLDITFMPLAEPQNTGSQGSSTALSISEEKAKQRQYALKAGTINTPQSEDESYLSNTRSLSCNVIPAIKRP